MESQKPYCSWGRLAQMFLKHLDNREITTNTLKTVLAQEIDSEVNVIHNIIDMRVNNFEVEMKKTGIQYVSYLTLCNMADMSPKKIIQIFDYVETDILYESSNNYENGRDTDWLRHMSHFWYGINSKPTFHHFFLSQFLPEYFLFIRKKKNRINFKFLQWLKKHTQVCRDPHCQDSYGDLEICCWQFKMLLNDVKTCSQCKPQHICPFHSEIFNVYTNINSREEIFNLLKN